MLPDLMHATQLPCPFHTKGWVYEEKYDGWRMLAVKETGRVRLVTRQGKDFTARFPDQLGRSSAPSHVAVLWNPEEKSKCRPSLV